VISPQHYPDLFAPRDWGFLSWQFTLNIPPDSLIANVNLVPFVGDQCVILHFENGKWEIPGGTLEPGEHYLATVHREALEEAGARVDSFHPLGAWACHSPLDKPYRPHMPHPDFFRLVGYGDVELITQPTMPEGGEKVARVEIVPIPEAERRFRSCDRADLADLYRLAAHLRKSP